MFFIVSENEHRLIKRLLSKISLCMDTEKPVFIDEVFFVYIWTRKNSNE